MGACPNGAQPKPGAAGLQVWVDTTKLAADVVSLLQRLAKLSYVSVAAELLDINTLCAENPDVPAALTPEDILNQTVAFGTFGGFGKNAVIEKIVQQLRYGQFLLSCDCADFPPPSAGMCPYNNFSVVLQSNQRSAAVAYDIPQSVYDSWPTTGPPPSGTWKAVQTWSFSNHTPATTQRFVEWSTDGSTWHPFFEFPNTSPGNSSCSPTASFIQPPRMPRAGFVSIHNNSVASFTLSGFSYCFCGQVSPPTPLPPQPQLPQIPDLPAFLCDNDTLCARVLELSHQIELLSRQVLEVQRYGLPFGYIPGAVHSGISGRGSFPIDRVLGIKVEITAHTTTRPALEGNPNYIWDQGWMSVMTGDGMLQEQRISQTARVWFPRLCFDATTFGYELNAGTVATITELRAEP